MKSMMSKVDRSIVQAVADSCTRCGAGSVQEPAPLCADCIAQLSEKRSLSAADVAEAVRVGAKKMMNLDRLVITIGAAIGPVLLILFVVTAEVLHACDLRSFHDNVRECEPCCQPWSW